MGFNPLGSQFRVMVATKIVQGPPGVHGRPRGRERSPRNGWREPPIHQRAEIAWTRGAFRKAVPGPNTDPEDGAPTPESMPWTSRRWAIEGEESPNVLQGPELGVKLGLCRAEGCSVDQR